MPDCGDLSGKCPLVHVDIADSTPGSVQLDSNTVSVTAESSLLDALLTKWELHSYIADFKSIGCADVNDLMTLSTSSSGQSRFDFTTVLGKMHIPERKRLLRVLGSCVRTQS
jgi:hypothetical protein